MRMLCPRYGGAALFVLLLALLLHQSIPIVNADSFVLKNPTTPLSVITYGRVGPGRYEAECATLSAGWTLRKATRGSKGSMLCESPKSHIESRSTTPSACLKFKNATRLGIGYVAGNYKGKAVVTLKDDLGNILDTETLETYDSYTDASFADTSVAAPATFSSGGQPPSGTEEGDFDESAPDATLTFWAFKWIYTEIAKTNTPAAPARGEICVSPKGVPVTRPMVSLDYFVIANGGSHLKMAQRGFARNHNYMSQAGTRSMWNYNGCGEVWTEPAGCFNNSNLAEMLPAVGSDSWEGFVPKIVDPSNWGNNDDSTRNSFKTTYVYAVILGARDYAGGADTFVPKYWILFNEPDMSGFFFSYDDGLRGALGPYPQPHPDDPKYLHGFVNLIWAIRQGYIDRGISPPKIIIESGSQTHAPGNSGTNHWAAEYCPVDDPEDPNDNTPDPFDDVPWKDRNGQSYWGCTNPNTVWITEFWNALKTDMTTNPGSYPLTLVEAKAAIGGFGGHYYPAADTNCLLPSCYLSTARPIELVNAIKAWMSSEFSDREVWIVETATHLTGPTGCTNVTFGQLGVAEQIDNFPCRQPDGTDKYYHIRNYVGKLQEAFAEAGVDRWAWFAERYGGKNPCPDGSGGEMTALNASCTSYLESPFANNFSLAAPYR